MKMSRFEYPRSANDYNYRFCNTRNVVIVMHAAVVSHSTNVPRYISSELLTKRDSKVS